MVLNRAGRPRCRRATATAISDPWPARPQPGGGISPPHPSLRPHPPIAADRPRLALHATIVRSRLLGLSHHRGEPHPRQRAPPAPRRRRGSLGAGRTGGASSAQTASHQGSRFSNAPPVFTSSGTARPASCRRPFESGRACSRDAAEPIEAVREGHVAVHRDREVMDLMRADAGARPGPSPGSSTSPSHPHGAAAVGRRTTRRPMRRPTSRPRGPWRESPRPSHRFAVERRLRPARVAWPRFCRCR